jgi:hypothetical protein
MFFSELRRCVTRPHDVCLLHHAGKLLSFYSVSNWIKFFREHIQLMHVRKRITFSKLVFVEAIMWEARGGAVG